MSTEPRKEDLVKEAQKAGLPTDGTKEELKERLESVTWTGPKTFEQRFDPLNPPSKDPGPVDDEGPDASAGVGDTPTV